MPRRRSIRASSSPTPIARISVARNEMVPRPVKKESLPYSTTRAPSTTGTGEDWMSIGEHVTDSDMSAAGSRSVRNAVRVPCRTDTWVS